MKNLVQPEPFLLGNAMLDSWDRGKSLVIPIPCHSDKALRIGLNVHWYHTHHRLALEMWCHVGPRQYKVIATREFVQQFEDMFGGSADELREKGIQVEGDLDVVEDE